MASLSTDPHGRRRILFSGTDGKRKTLRLGRTPKKSAETIRTHVEHLLTCRIAGTAPPDATARWVAGLGDDLHERLSRVGLVEPRGAGWTLGEMLDSFFATLGVRDSTLITYDQTRRCLVEYFGAGRPIESITALDCERWRAWLAESLAPATVSKRVKTARQVFSCAIRWERLDRNPFEGVRAGHQRNHERSKYVDRETIGAVLDACPDARWRAIVGLCRYAGLRCPSEVGLLCWEDVSWDRGRLTIKSPKTAGHDGHAVRVAPIAPELRPLLLEMFETVEPGTKAVVPGLGAAVNLRTQLLRIIARAGVEPWPRLFQNLRASCATDWTECHPAHAVAKWLGHSPMIAAEHYLQVRDHHFDDAAGLGSGSTSEATQNPTQHPPARGRTRGNPSRPGRDPDPACASVRRSAGHKSLSDKDLVTPTGLEPVSPP